MRTTEALVPPRFVVDSSVISKFFLVDEELVEQAHSVLRAYAAGDIDLVAPFAVMYEVPASIRKAVLRNRISWRQAHTLIDNFVALPLPLITPEPATSRQIVARAFGISEQLDRSFYDAVFVAFAEMLGLPFLTADKPLATSASTAIEAVFLGDFGRP